MLATAAHHSIADAVAAHLKIFDEVVATDGQTNTKGTAKRDALLARFGMRGFDYIGDDRADLPVWGASRVAHVAGNRRDLPELAQMAGAALGQPFSSARPGLRIWIREMRVHQWVKNVLLFIPMVMAHRVDARTTLTIAIAFLSFSLLASGTYLINDLLDLDADRKHPSKRSRPFASGKIPLAQGVLAAFLLIVTAFGLGTTLGIRPVVYLLLYFVVTIAYSLRLKHHPILDVVALAFLYTLRILAGGAAADIRISQWLFQFSVFLFLSLALVKRYSELHRLELAGTGDRSARGYRAADLTIVSQFGISAGLIAGLVLALYVNSPEVRLLYRQPHILWAVCPIFVYWIVYVWLIAGRGGMGEDPILFAFRDRTSYLAGVTILIVMFLAMLPHVS